MKLSDICIINPKPSLIEDDADVSFVGMADVSEDGKMQTGTIRSYLEVKKGYTPFEEGDVLFAKITPCMENGKGALAVGLINGLGCGSTEFHILRPFPEFADGRWLYYLTAWPTFRKNAALHMTGSAGQKRVPKSFLENYDVNVPTLNVQREQVQVLDQVAAIKAARQKQLDALDELVKARFIEMFGDEGYRRDFLKNSVEEMFIGPFGSSLKNEYFVDKDESYCMVYEQKHAIQKTMNVPTRYVAKDKYLELKRFTVLPNDIIVSCRGTIGESFIIPENAPMGIMHPSIMKIRLKKEKYNPIFFIFLLNRYMEENAAKANGSSVKMAVNAKTLEKEPFIIPTLSGQNQFADFVHQVDQTKTKIRESLAETETLFQSLMQEYFG